MAKLAEINDSFSTDGRSHKNHLLVILKHELKVGTDVSEGLAHQVVLILKDGNRTVFFVLLVG